MYDTNDLIIVVAIAELTAVAGYFAILALWPGPLWRDELEAVALLGLVLVATAGWSSYRRRGWKHL